jgi:hypothetical protein
MEDPKLPFIDNKKTLIQNASYIKKQDAYIEVLENRVRLLRLLLEETRRPSKTRTIEVREEKPIKIKHALPWFD